MNTISIKLLLKASTVIAIAVSVFIAWSISDNACGFSFGVNTLLQNSSEFSVPMFGTSVSTGASSKSPFISSVPSFGTNIGTGIIPQSSFIPSLSSLSSGFGGTTSSQSPLIPSLSPVGSGSDGGILPQNPVIAPVLKVDFDYSVEDFAHGEPYSVRFFDRSTGSISQRTWNFGDGGTSNEQNPIHSYAEHGLYKVCLTVERPSLYPGAASLPDTKCTYVHVEDVIVQLLDKFFGPFEQQLGNIVAAGADSYNELISTVPFKNLSQADKEMLLEILDDSETRATEIVAFLIRHFIVDYKPFIYFYVGAGADICDLLGNPSCDIGLNAVGYLYFDLMDMVHHDYHVYTGRNDVFLYYNEDQDAHNNYITVLLSQGGTLGVGTNPGFGLLFAPRPKNKSLDWDFDFNDLPDTWGELQEVSVTYSLNVLSCLLGDWTGCAFNDNPLDNAVTYSATALGFLADEDGGFGMETTLAGYTASTQIVRVDVDAEAIMSAVLDAIQCGLDIYQEADGLYGSPVDYARVFTEAFQIDPLTTPPLFSINCGNIRCDTRNCDRVESLLTAYRDVSWGPPIIILQELARILPVEITYVSIESDGSMIVRGTLDETLNFETDFAPNDGGSLTLWNNYLFIDVIGGARISEFETRLSGSLKLFNYNFGEADVKISSSDRTLLCSGQLLNCVTYNYRHSPSAGESLTIETGSLSMEVTQVNSLSTAAANFRGRVKLFDYSFGETNVKINGSNRSVSCSGQLFNYLNYSYNHTSIPTVSESLTIGTGALSMNVGRIISIGEQSARFNGQLYWEENLLGNLDVTATANKITARTSVVKTGISKNISDENSITLNLSITITGNVDIEATSNGSVSAEFRGSVTTTCSIGVGDFDYDFDRTYAGNVDYSVSSDGSVIVSYYYPKIIWISEDIPYLCGVSLSGPRICSKIVSVPTGVETKTGTLRVDLW
ncbi:MAG: PKD domain-containing protein [bacterium]